MENKKVAGGAEPRWWFFTIPLLRFKTLTALATFVTLSIIPWQNNLSAEVSDLEIRVLRDKIIQAESSGKADSIGDRGRSRGLMQIQKAVWKKYTDVSWDLAFNPLWNKTVGEEHLKRIRDHYGKRATPALVALSYNTGKWYKTIPAWALRHPNMVYRNLMKG